MTLERKLEYDVVYLKMACELRPLSFAIRSKVGCLIVSDDDQIIAQGYNGMPKGFPNACEHQVWNETTQKYDLKTNDEVLHAESNAIAKCAKWEASCQGATAYVTLSPCLQCSKLLVQSGIKRVVFLDEYRDMTPLEFLIKGGVTVQKLDLLHKSLDEYFIDNESGLLSSYRKYN